LLKRNQCEICLDELDCSAIRIIRHNRVQFVFPVLFVERRHCSRMLRWLPSCFPEPN